MAKLSIKAGATSVSINIFIADSSSTTGAGLTGLVFNSSSLVAYYALPAAAAVAITLATLAAVTSAYSSGGFKEIDATNMPGWYRFDIPNAALASGRFVAVHLKGATNMAPLPLEIELTAWDNQDTVRGGLTALPNVAIGGMGALPIAVTASGSVDVSTFKSLAQTAADLGAGPRVVVNGAGTAQAGGASTITLSNSSSSTDNIYRGEQVAIYNNTGVDQVRTITGYVGSTKVATVDEPWQINPDNTSQYRVYQERTPKLDSALRTTDINSTAPPINWGLFSIDASGRVDVIKLNGTSQTARDIGASVLLSTGTGTGQLDFTSGVVKANLAQILGTALTETAGLLAGGFKKFFNVASPTLTTLGIDQTGDSYARIGAAGAGLTALGDTRIANLDTTVSSRLAPAGTLATVTNLTNAPTAGDFTATMKTSLNAATPVVALAAGAIQAIWDALTSALTTVGSIGKRLADDIDATISSRSTFAGGAVASVTGNVGGNVNGNVVGSVGSVTAGVTVTTNNDKTGYGISAAAVQAVWDALTSALTTAGSIGKLLAALPGSIWDVVLSGHTTSGTTGAALSSASSAGDPWNTALPGAYGAGTAGKIIGDNIDTTISSRTKPADTQAAVTLVATTTNLTNAPTAGDFTTTMKTSLNAATPAVTVSDKTGFSLSSAGIQAIWDKLTSVLTTVGSIGKLLVDNINATISSRSTFAGGAVASVTGSVASVSGSVGSVVGSVGSVVADVGITQVAADKVLGSSAAVLPELASVPAASPRPAQLLMLMYQALRNKLTVAAPAKTIFNDAGVALGTKTLSDDGTTYTEDKLS